MRVLWFTNIPMPAVERRTGISMRGSGHWMSTVLQALAGTPEVELGVATAYPGATNLEFAAEGVRYWVMGQPRTCSYLSCRARDLERSVEIVEQFRPDLVHVHGTERFFGLLGARRLVNVPVVVSLQGFLNSLVPTFWGALSLRDIVSAHRFIEVATKRGLVWERYGYAAAAQQEREIISGAQAFLGRTAWDEAQVRSWNATASYYRVDEMMRPEFRDQQWDPGRHERNSIFVTSAGAPRRGFDVLLGAITASIGRYPEMKVRVAGAHSTRTGYGRFLEKKVNELGLRHVVTFLGYLGPNELVAELRKANVFVLPSLAENSPNSLCEAMCVGTPVVASFAGGIPSLVSDGRTGLLFPPGDAVALGAQLRRVFDHPESAAQLAAEGRSVALRRHEQGRVTAQLLAAYAEVAAAHQERSGAGERKS